MEPLFDVVEGLIVSYIINYNDAMGSSIVGRGDGAEALLSSSVPNLKLDRLAIKLNRADFLRKKRSAQK